MAPIAMPDEAAAWRRARMGRAERPLDARALRRSSSRRRRRRGSRPAIRDPATVVERRGVEEPAERRARAGSRRRRASRGRRSGGRARRPKTSRRDRRRCRRVSRMPNVAGSTPARARIAARRAAPQTDAEAEGEKHPRDGEMHGSWAAGAAGLRNRSALRPRPCGGRRRPRAPRAAPGRSAAARKPRAARRRCAWPRRSRGRRAGLAPGLEVAPVRDHRREEGGPVARLRVLRAEEMAARADLAHRVERQLGRRRPPAARRNSATISSRSASSTIFSKEACRPPSIQPAPCIRKLTPPMIAPQSEKTLS